MNNDELVSKAIAENEKIIDVLNDFLKHECNFSKQVKIAVAIRVEELERQNKELREAKIVPKDIHEYFGLSYADYFTVPRSVLQSMPKEWQEKFVLLLQELDKTKWHDLLPNGTCYKVELRLEDYDKNDRFKWGKKVNDPLINYDRGRRNIFQEGEVRDG